LRYIRERERLLASQKAATSEPTKAAGEDAKEDGTASGGADGVVDKTGPKEQKVLVLDRGFVGWQEVYGTDERLTEGYRKELWVDGYWG
jgi:Cdc25 family phosphatase